MSLTIESASALLYRMYNSCEERNDKIDAEAIEVALECMREIEKQKYKDYFACEGITNHLPRRFRGQKGISHVE